MVQKMEPIICKRTGQTIWNRPFIILGKPNFISSYF